MKPNNRIEYRFGTLPRGVHFFCVPKRNEPKKKAPYVLACGSPGKIVASGKSKKLASLTNLSGTNLDAEGSRVVTGMAATNQAGESSPEKKRHSRAGGNLVIVTLHGGIYRL